ncbi:hypothetical protein VTG60DRAFT_5331 [Thermothelomyces hinnuleus]
MVAELGCLRLQQGQLPIWNVFMRYCVGGRFSLSTYAVYRHTDELPRRPALCNPQGRIRDSGQPTNPASTPPPARFSNYTCSLDPDCSFAGDSSRYKKPQPLPCPWLSWDIRLHFNSSPNEAYLHTCSVSPGTQSVGLLNSPPPYQSFSAFK